MSDGWIDLHHHVLPPALVEVLDAEGIVEVAGRDRPEWTPDLALEVMDRQGIATAVLSVSATGVHFGHDGRARDLARACNDHVADLVRQEPTRFGSFASLPLPDVEGSVAEVAHAHDVAGADGFVLQSSHVDGTYLGDPRFDPVLAALDEREAVVFVHPAIPRFVEQVPIDLPVFAMEFTFDTTRAAFNLVHTGALERYPNIRWVLAHAGGTVPYLVSRFSLLWAIDDALAERAPQGALAYLSRLHYDTALSANPHALASLAELVGWDHVVFGSDYPFAPELVTQLSTTALATDDRFTPADLDAIRRTNALTLLPRLAERLP